ncbi:hypothetical protein M9H77_29876 [Catharanthus roseus]|uniref:Uncharacterized protein n=1 Tax=Catharanthus roseus TaxID=4058 RepID=A0ACB9ZW02_CATRO|nr:hypothetical protein M9H77_29876 [Catharanthus roseus]
MIQAESNKSIPYGMLLTKLFRYLKIDLTTEIASEGHEKGVIGKQFAERLLVGRRKDDVELSKSKNNESMPEISYKSDSEEESEGEVASSGSDSSLDDNKKDIPIQTVGKFFIDEEVARKRALVKKNKALKELVEKEPEEIVEQEASQATTNLIKYKPCLGKGGKTKAVVAAAHALEE